MRAVLAALMLVGVNTAALAVEAVNPDRALREMQIHKVPELGLQVWVENQPAWEAALSNPNGHPSFVAQSPATYHPPTVMTYASWPKLSVTSAMLPGVATSAIRRASQNFGLNAGQSRGIAPRPVAYGNLQGYEASFTGRTDGVPMDVRIFVGQAAGKFPVVLCIYTLQGKMGQLGEVIRRGWGRVNYLAP
jgi:hypothetical protein